MAQNAGETYNIGITNVIIGMGAYIFFVVPMLTLTLVGALNLTDGYDIAIATAFVITGLYVTEKFVCFDS